MKSKAKKQKPSGRKLFGGRINVPVRRSSFGPYLDLADRIPEDADCIMVLVNSGGLNAGHPKPVGFIKLTHQLYLEDLKTLLKEQRENDEQSCSGGIRWITIVPIRSGEYVDVWTRD